MADKRRTLQRGKGRRATAWWALIDRESGEIQALQAPGVPKHSKRRTRVLGPFRKRREAALATVNEELRKKGIKGKIVSVTKVPKKDGGGAGRGDVVHEI